MLAPDYEEPEQWEESIEMSERSEEYLYRASRSPIKD